MRFIYFLDYLPTHSHKMVIKDSGAGDGLKSCIIRNTVLYYDKELQRIWIIPKVLGWH
jgi:hypothetical protein